MLEKRPMPRMPDRSVPELKLMSFNVRRFTAGASVVSSRITKNRRPEKGGNGQVDDEVGRKPVLLVAFFEHDLQGAEADRHEEEPRKVYLPLLLHEVRRVLDKAHDEEDVDDAYGHVDEEDPGPGIVVGEPPAEGGREGRPQDYAEAVDAHGLRLFLRVERSPAG